MGSHLPNLRTSNNARARKILAWMRANPIPKNLRAIDTDGEEIEVVVQPEQGRVRWTDAMRAVYKCTEITALDDKGKILRVLDLPAHAEDEAEVQRLELAHQQMLAQADARLPGREPIISVDVPVLVEKIATSMQKVAEASAKQTADGFSSGFQAMTDVVTLCINMLQRIDERLADREEEAQRTIEARAEEVRQLQEQTGGTEPGGINRDQLAQAAFARILNGDLFGGANGKGAPNGNGHGQVNKEQAAQLAQMLQQYADQQGTEGES